MLAKSVVLALLALRATTLPFPQSDSAQNCQSSYDGTFGVTIMNSTTAAATSQMGDGQPNASGAQQIADGQVQSGGVTQIADGQPQNNPASQIADGQVQNNPVSQINDGQVQNNPVSQINDGQVQNAGGSGATQMPDGQVNSGGATQMADGQVNTGGTTQMPDGQVNTAGSGSSGGSGGGLTGCKKDDTLTLTLKDGILTDSQGRTGYIASNFQYQFDNPPQAGTITASGFSICNGALALNGKDTWFQCLSGTFYNIYDRRPEGRQDCEEVKMMVLNLQEC